MKILLNKFAIVLAVYISMQRICRNELVNYSLREIMFRISKYVFTISCAG